MFIHKNFSRSLRLAVMAFVAMTLSLSAWAQNISVTGTVTDVNGEPVIGAYVLVQGTSTGTSTDVDGKYQIDVPGNGTLVFTLVGMKDAVVPVNGKAVINVTMQEDAEMLEDVVVVGFGTQKKENLTGAVASVNVEKVLAGKPIQDITKGLQGTVPGLTITYASNDMSAAPTIKVRGNGSINGSNQPLILLDGVEIPDLSFVNPDNVKSISVLKDAASSSIYGARAAYGVVLITSKDGSNMGDRVTVSYSNNLSWNTPMGLPKYITDKEGILAQLDEGILAQKNTDGTDIEAFGMYFKDLKAPIANWFDKYYDEVKAENSQVYKYGRDWEFDADGTSLFYRVADPNEELFKTAFQHNHNLSVAGSSGKTNFNMAIGYSSQDGTLKAAQEQNMKRANFNVSTNTQVTKWLNLGTKVMYTEKVQKYPYGYEASNGAMGLLYYTMRFPTFFPFGVSDGGPKDANGNFLYPSAGDAEGIYFCHGNGFVAYEPTCTSKDQYLTVGANLKAQLAENLTLNADYTRGQYNYNNETIQQWRWNAYFWSAYAPYDWFTNKDRLTKSWVTRTTNTYNAYLDYLIDINEEHNFAVKVGFNAEDLTYNYNNAYSDGIQYPNLPTFNLTNGASGGAYVDEALRDRATAGFFVRLNYDYKGKYLLELNGRYDGSSMFKTGEKWAFFPSASVGYRISEEDFWSEIKPVISNMKIRASFGEIGNQDIAASSNYYPFISLIQTTTSNWINGGDYATTYTMPDVIGSSMTWERIRTLDFGLDMGFFKGDLNLMFDWYQRENLGMLVPRNEVVAYGGFPSLPLENSGNLRTRGWELQIDYNHAFENGLAVYTTFTLADSKSVITKWNHSTGDLTSNYVGKELGEIWGLTTATENNGYFTQAEVDNGVQTAVGNKTISEYQGSLQSGNFVYGAGDTKYKDLNGNGYIDSGAGTIDDHGDLKRIGNTLPRFEYSWRIGASWKGFDAEVLLQGVGKREMWTTSSLFIPHAAGAQMNIFSNQLDYWTAENTDAKFPRPYIGHTGGTLEGISLDGGNNFYPQTKYLQDISFLRIKNLTVGYTIPAKVTKKIDIDKVRVYLSCQNLFTFDNIDGVMDPELTGGWYSVSGIDGSTTGRAMPFNRQISCGVQISF